MVKKGKLIVFEGIDGTGKTTQAHMLINALLSKNVPARYLHFPRIDDLHSIYPRLIKSFLKGEWGSKEEVDPYLIAFLYAGDRKEVSRWMQDEVNQGTWLVLDRYVMSNMAYQGCRITDTHKNKFIRWLHHTEYDLFNLPQPDLTFLLDMPLQFTIQNVQKSRKQKDRATGEDPDLFERDLIFQQKVRNMYLLVAKHEKNVIVMSYAHMDNVPPPEKIHHDILQYLF